jgi:hypothetical protein
MKNCEDWDNISYVEKTQPGDKIYSELDKKDYYVIRYAPRDDMTPLGRVKLIGNAALVEDEKHNRFAIFDWDFQLYTCNHCDKKETCPFLWNRYCTNGDCLANEPRRKK